MSKPVLGMLVGAVLGVLDGVSALASPDARPMIMAIVVGSTVKGTLTGWLAGWIARRWQSTALGVVAGIAVGFVLSTLAAIPLTSSQPGHYLEIVLPGMLLGALVGFVTQRYPTPRARPSSTDLSSALALILVALPGALLSSQQAGAPGDPLQPLERFIGKWEGGSEGQPGAGTVRREYNRILNSRYVRLQNQSVYPPQEKNPNGEVHEDLGIFSFDTARGRIVLRQFHVEGFVNQYVAEPAFQKDTLVFTTEGIENIPAGWRGRETYIVRGPDDFEEVFELAAPGKEFELYSRTKLKRVR